MSEAYDARGIEERMAALGAKQKVTRLLFLFLAAFFSQGCTVLTYGTFSAPVVPEDEATIVSKEGIHWYGRNKGDVIAIPGATLKILPLNEHVSFNVWGIIVPFLPLPGGSNDSELYDRWRRKHPSFLINLSLVPQGDDLIFDLKGVRLHLTTGERLQPIGFWGPQTASHWRYQPNLCRAYEPGDRVPLISTDQAPESVEIKEETCFTLLFDTAAPFPDQAFSLSITGMRKGGQPYAIPTIRFERDSGWEFDLVPVQ